jgi:hypothetical protein
MTTATTTAPAPAPASATLATALMDGARAELRELAWQCAGGISIQSEILAKALEMPHDGQAQFAWRELRRIGKALGTVMEALGRPTPGPDGDCVPDVKKGRLQ